MTQLADTREGSRDAQLAADVRRVDWVQNAGELGAMLLESSWSRTQKALYNRRLRSNADSATLRLAGDGSGRVHMQRIDALEPGQLAQSFGVFHSEKDARKDLTDIARAQQL